MQKQYLGPLPEWEYEEFSDQLWDYCNNSGQGIMGFYPGNVPPDCLDFCASQYNRFNVTMPPEEVIQLGASSAFWYLDGHDPYLLFTGITDVKYTSEWNLYAYELMDEGSPWEISMDSLETFVHEPGTEEDTFHDLMSHPGIDSIEWIDTNEVREMLFADYGCYPLYDINNEAEVYLRNLCRNEDGSLSKKKYEAYFELAAWAGFAWLTGPLSKEYRIRNHEIFYSAIKCGECILVDGEVIEPGRYRKLQRPPRSCYKCGLSSWCVDLVCREGVGTSYICEHCVSAGMPPSRIATCGTKICHLAECPHHPLHHMGAAGIHQSRRQYGQLSNRGSQLKLNSNISLKRLR